MKFNEYKYEHLDLEKIKKDYGELDYLKKLQLLKIVEDIVLVEGDLLEGNGV